MEEFNEKSLFSNSFFKTVIPELFCKGFQQPNTLLWFWFLFKTYLTSENQKILTMNFSFNLLIDSKHISHQKKRSLFQ